MQPNKSIQNHRGPALHGVLHGIFRSSSLNFILFPLKLLGGMKGAFKACYSLWINGVIQPQINKVYT